MLDLLSPLGGIIAGIAAFLAALWFNRQKGRQEAKAERAAQDSAAYAAERKRQDEMDIGIGASDAERIERLRRIANGGGSGNP